MKTINCLIWCAGLALALTAWTAEPNAPTPDGTPPANSAGDAASAGAEEGTDASEAGTPAVRPSPGRSDTSPSVPPEAMNAGAAPGSYPADGLRLNFRNAPLDLVLNYLSEAAGFIIVLETEVKGKVDVWSNQPVSREEAVALLNSVLNKNGYAAIRNDRTLTIVSRDEAKKRDIPVRTGNKPEDIPKTDEMVTQIIPVRYANAMQMTKDLQPLLPTYATLTANESGNALVLTDLQSDVRRMTEIVQALDTSISGISSIRVFPLRYADAKELANVVKELFPATGSTGRGGAANDPRAMFMARFGGGGPGGRGGGDAAAAAAAAGTGTSEARQAAARVTAVADERTNSLVVNAPDEVMDTIVQLVEKIDKDAENITELRVFPLRFADPQEMADILVSLFPDETRSNTTRSSVQFGRGGFAAGRAQQTGGQDASSDRARQKGRVLAVADLRTSSLIVSAASDLMPQIGEMIAQLDANPARKQKVFVYSLENADVDQVQQVLQNMFERNTTTGNRNRNTSTQNNALSNRATRNQNTTGTSSAFGNSGFGGTGNRGGNTGSGF
jgi:general secretion pathway protein D